MLVLRRPLLLTLTATALGCNANPYLGGGEYPVGLCSKEGEGLVAQGADERLWDTDPSDTDDPPLGRTRDFALLDEHAYRVRLTHFCTHTVLLVSGDMRDPEDPTRPGPLDWLEALPAWVANRDPEAPPLTVITAWWANADGDVPSVGDLRRFRDTVTELRGEGAWLVDYPGAPATGSMIITVQDARRFPGAAAAAGSMYVASDVPPDPDPDRRYRREHEVRDRWHHRDPPYFVVLQPALRITAMGSDPEADGIIDALEIDPGELQ